ncbi:hypothetical protein PBI_SEBATA_50 [Mycobacterium phage Sebata]|uniref:Uncharacterized protein n=8 Tax=Bixzunavirus TaxID=680114 RepID=Q853M8_BPMBZ|nr:gp49 [Mycobacterium phage Bxz1]YP_009221179.1 hypothetical protein AWH68_gp049 [Mycobacterium phage Breeniome]YP_009608735.1 hypothetical protein FDI20_gp050 [Mycobacterium phage Sebata]YP_010057002.1 hypothetical protein KHO58_gp054 [Mycobacterium phage Bigswole]YP_010057690.1 hypothetical protein KHO61_gp050 [Mycobacterium phage Mangeria]YP_010057922.1 hypothetical protein KHO62_gp048 [Mycobacterium phage NoodleTree]YP_010510458.1 hypothetical protein OLP41_gp050 [Mycobacterium phage I3]
MASITITISDITSDYLDADVDELSAQLTNVAGIIEAAVGNAVTTEAISFSSIDVDIDIDED